MPYFPTAHSPLYLFIHDAHHEVAHLHRDSKVKHGRFEGNLANTAIKLIYCAAPPYREPEVMLALPCWHGQVVQASGAALADRPNIHYV